MVTLAEAVLRTILYADVFDFPMTLEEIHHFLIAEAPVPLDDVYRAVQADGPLEGLIEGQDGLFFRAGRAQLVALRRSRQESAAHLLPQALRYGRWLARLPFVRMVAITGALAMQNPSGRHDDIDYMVVTCVNRVWTARALAILLVRLARLHGVTICPNYVVAESALLQTRQDVFIAHEVVQMLPLFGAGLHQHLRTTNAWVATYLPNAEHPLHKHPEVTLGRPWIALKRLLETILLSPLGQRFETWEYQRKRERFAPRLHQSQSAAAIDAEQVKGHFDDHGHPILIKYHQRLRDFLPHTITERAPGD